MSDIKDIKERLLKARYENEYLKDRRGDLHERAEDIYHNNQELAVYLIRIGLEETTRQETN